MHCKLSEDPAQPLTFWALLYVSCWLQLGGDALCGVWLLVVKLNCQGLCVLASFQSLHNSAYLHHRVLQQIYVLVLPLYPLCSCCSQIIDLHNTNPSTGHLHNGVLALSKTKRSCTGVATCVMAACQSAPDCRLRTLGHRPACVEQEHLQLHMAEGCAQLLQRAIAGQRSIPLQPHQSLLVSIGVSRKGLQHNAAASAKRRSRHGLTLHGLPVALRSFRPS